MARLPFTQFWLLALLTSGLVLLTCLQAQGSIPTRGIRLVNQSRGYSLFVLRTVSELAALALSATISTSWENLKWALLFRKQGSLPLVDFLALDEGTAVLPLMGLVAGRSGQSVRTRIWSVVRLLSIVVIPVTGILIMSTSISSGAKLTAWPGNR